MKHPIKTVYFHEGTSFHMQGKNFGNKVDSSFGAKICYDDEAKEIHIYYNGKISSLSSLAAKNWDYVQSPEHLIEYFQLSTPAQPAVSAHPLVARARLDQFPLAPIEVPYPDFDENDMEAAARHRELVRAASANANRNQPLAQQNDHLIQESRNAAMGIKVHKTAQVQTAHQVGETASIRGKPKAINHQQLKTQLAAEMKDPNA